jgi:hypothetical protein
VTAEESGEVRAANINLVVELTVYKSTSDGRAAEKGITLLTSVVVSSAPPDYSTRSVRVPALKPRHPLVVHSGAQIAKDVEPVSRNTWIGKYFVEFIRVAPHHKRVDT